MLVWLHGAPTATVMKEKLQSPDFRSRVATYIDSNIRAHHDNITEQTLSASPCEKSISYS